MRAPPMMLNKNDKVRIWKITTYSSPRCLDQDSEIRLHSHLHDEVSES